MDTDTIPDGVDPELASERTALIESWRSGKASAEATFSDLLDLYWETQQHTNGPTNVYLMEASYQFPVEASLPSELASEIWNSAISGR